MDRDILMRAGAPANGIAAGALCFALLAAAIRSTTQGLVETRYQFLGFLLLFLLVEGMAHRRGRGVNRIRFGVNLFAVATALLAVKWGIEGVSPYLIRLWKMVVLV
jgi:hypothetical protein